VRWPWRRHLNGSKDIRKDAEAKLAAAKNTTPMVAKRAAEIADLTADEFAARVDKAFRRRPA
jgi:hypothetical protein